MKERKAGEETYNPEDYPVVLFDSYCLICDGFVQFLLRIDREGKLKYSGLDSAKAQAEIHKRAIPIPKNDSVILLNKEDYFLESGAVLETLKITERYTWLRKTAALFPRAFRDTVYRFIARNRYRLLDKKKSCPLPEPSIRSRFI